jgi:hypothetical protein
MGLVRITVQKPHQSTNANGNHGARQQYGTQDFSARPSDLLKLFLAALVKGDDFQDGGLPSQPQLEQWFYLPQLPRE